MNFNNYELLVFAVIAICIAAILIMPILLLFDIRSELFMIRDVLHKIIPKRLLSDLVKMEKLRIAVKKMKGDSNDR